MTEPVAVNTDFYMRITRKVPGEGSTFTQWSGIVPSTFLASVFLKSLPGDPDGQVGLRTTGSRQRILTSTQEKKPLKALRIQPQDPITAVGNLQRGAKEAVCSTDSSAEAYPGTM